MKSTPIVPAPSATSKDMTILETFYDVSKGKTELSSELQPFLERGDRPIVFPLGSAFL